LRHDCGPLGPGLDVTVVTRHVAQLAHVDLERSHSPADEGRCAMFLERPVEGRVFVEQRQEPGS